MTTFTLFPFFVVLLSLLFVAGLVKAIIAKLSRKEGKEDAEEENNGDCCVHCGNEVTGDYHFCNNCGRDPDEVKDRKFCNSCGKKAGVEGGEFCAYCGDALDEWSYNFCPNCGDNMDEPKTMNFCSSCGKSAASLAEKQQEKAEEKLVVCAYCETHLTPDASGRCAHCGAASK